MRAHVFSLFFTCFVYQATTQTTNAPNAAPDSPSNNITKLHVAIYYESLCYDSMDFLTNQFSPAYESFKDFIDVLFVPFGKSESENNGEYFFCQHGPAECSGNKLQSCVLDALVNDQDAKAKFVTCQMKFNAEYTGRKCADLVNASFADIEKCSTGPRGVELQLDAEKQTHTIRKPYPRFVPTIVYNQQFNGRKQWLSLRQFKKQLCEELEPIKKAHEQLLKLCA